MSRIFPNASDRIVFTGSSLSSATYLFWFKPNRAAQYESLLIAGSGAVGIYHTGTGANIGKINFYNGGPPEVEEFSDSALTNSVWSHVGITVSGVNVGFFLNGVADGTAANGTSITMTNIGDKNSGGEQANGSIAECCIYNRVLTVTDIQIIMRSGPFTIPNGLIRYFPLFGVQSPEPDWSGNNNHGTVTGAARADHPPGISAIWMAPNPRRVERIPVAGSILMPQSIF